MARSPSRGRHGRAGSEQPPAEGGEVLEPPVGGGREGEGAPRSRVGEEAAPAPAGRTPSVADGGLGDSPGAGEAEATAGRDEPAARDRGPDGHVLVVFAGSGAADSTLARSLRARGIGATEVDIAQGGADHDVLRDEVGGALLRE
eukprot:1794332-Pleurochrysis_carterae.AAC.1